MLEVFWYESSPYIYSAVGVFALANSNFMGVFFGTLLLAVSLVVIRLRWEYRRHHRLKTKIRSRPNP
ncbi:MAG TPA: hypothetical protein VI457_09025 [Methylococcaceae bacterium]|nr:hypothetical protein [Methylococcaceae bacterium]